jgi:hypothetical protein
MGSNPDISQKYKTGDISKGVANTLALQKKYYKYVVSLQYSIHPPERTAKEFKISSPPTRNNPKRGQGTLQRYIATTLGGGTLKVLLLRP